MKKLAVLFISAVAFGGTNWDGHYVGTGHFVTKSGLKGNYTVSMTFKAGTMSSHYEYTMPDGTKKSMDYTGNGTIDKNGFLSFSSGNVKGEGYCFDVWCHSEIPSAQLEETLVVKDKQAFRLGSKMIPTTPTPGVKKPAMEKVIWEEMMTKQ